MELSVQIREDVFIDVVGNYTPHFAGVRYYPDGSGQPPEPSELDITSAILRIVNGDKDVTMDAPDALIELFYDEIMDEADRKYFEERNNAPD